MIAITPRFTILLAMCVLAATSPATIKRNGEDALSASGEDDCLPQGSTVPDSGAPLVAPNTHPSLQPATLQPDHDSTQGVNALSPFVGPFSGSTVASGDNIEPVVTPNIIPVVAPIVAPNVNRLVQPTVLSSGDGQLGGVAPSSGGDQSKWKKVSVGSQGNEDDCDDNTKREDHHGHRD